MSDVFTHLDNLPIISCDYDPKLCEGRFCDCAEWRRAHVIAKCREIESRLDRAVIDELERKAAESWAVLFARAALMSAANSNGERTTVRPPSMRAAPAKVASHG
jgi:hypothetical protein